MEQWEENICEDALHIVRGRTDTRRVPGRSLNEDQAVENSHSSSSLDRGRPARNEHEARDFPKTARLRRVAAGRPRSQQSS
jgi:hypothetical protein